MFLNLTKQPTPIELSFLSRVITSSEQNVCLVSGSAVPLIFRPKPFDTNCIVRTEDANKVGGVVHPSWQLITDEEWLALIENHKLVSW